MNFGILLKEWIMEQWEKNYYISAIAGANNGSSLVVMSKGLFCYLWSRYDSIHKPGFDLC